MLLTLRLCKIMPYRFRGKYRLVKKVTNLDVAEVHRDLEIERRNMFFLRNPYLKAREWDSTPAEEKRIDSMKLLEKLRQERIKHFQRYQESRTLNYFLKNTLGHTEKWE